MPVPPPLGPTAAALLRSVDLLPDGPGVWGRPIAAGGSGVYLVELPDPPATAPLELSRVGKWLERVPGLRLDGERPVSRSLAAVLAEAWLPGQPVLYIGATTHSIGGRLASLYGHVPGDRRPHADGQWLHLLLPGAIKPARVWWAATDAPEEYLDALLDAFAATAAGGSLPWANRRSPSGRRRETGISGDLLPAEERAPTPPPRVVTLPDGDADGARSEAPASGSPGTGSTRRAPRMTGQRSRVAGSGSGSGAAAGAGSGTGSAARRQTAPTAGLAPRERPEPPSNELTIDGQARLQVELAELVGVRRPEVIARIRTAKELGDLKENADYSAAREEQSFLEGRIQAIEARLRSAVIIDPAANTGGRAALGSVLRVDEGGEELTYTLVGASESDPGSGRISVDSPGRQGARWRPFGRPRDRQDPARGRSLPGRRRRLRPLGEGAGGGSAGHGAANPGILRETTLDPGGVLRPMLEFDALDKRYGTITALDDASFSVAQGRLVGFLGPNGAGKTTAMRCVFGLVRPDRGEVRWEGKVIEQSTRLRFGYMPEQRGLYPRMQVHEQLSYFAQHHGLTAKDANAAATRWLERLGIADRAKSRLEDLSHGNQQRVQLATALVHDPELLVLDEPFSGLDPIGTATMSEVLRERAAAGVAVVFSSHQLDLVEDLCEDVAIISSGRIVAHGEIEALRRASGRTHVDVEVEGSQGAWVDTLPGSTVVDRRGDHVRLLVDAATDLGALLAAATAAGTVRRFAYQPPALSELFMEAVGMDHRTGAPKAAGASTNATVSR